ncbi:MAG: hypothetical protein IJU19_05835, partial [Bacteroidales bacterium]|nr:hypothetical protein [Bacteroidales bacterium]
CAFLFPDSEAMIHEAGFHSVLFFSIYNTKCQLLLLHLIYAFAGRAIFFSAPLARPAVFALFSPIVLQSFFNRSSINY